MGVSVLAICAGASAGALLRWQLGLWLNRPLNLIPWGTVTANLAGGYLIGLAAGFFLARPELPPQWRLFLVTGFLGGFTTFSTFSAEVIDQLQRGQLGAASLNVVLQVAGSLVLTVAGLAHARALWPATP